MARNKKRGGGLLFGPIIAFVALGALWKNETRFDYYRAAAKTQSVTTLQKGSDPQLISYTGEMDRRLEIKGEYIDSFTGYLVIYRDAEIYCWDRDEDDEGHVSWNREWKSSVESNSRNSGLKQTLSDGTLMPSSYQVGDLPIQSELIEFVDASPKLSLSGLEVSAAQSQLANRGSELYLSRGRGDKLGDERLRYTAIRVPQTATWFGRYNGQIGTADTSNRRTGWINALIQDTGILHHLVAGERTTALSTIKGHIQRLKWIVRIAGTIAVCMGFLFLFSSIVRWVYHIPVIGWLAEKGAFLLAIGIGVPLALLTICAGFIAGHPLLLAALAAVVVVVGWFGFSAARSGRRSQQGAQKQLEKQYGHALQPDEMKEMEYMELARLSAAGSGLGQSQSEFLNDWGAKHGWEQEKQQSMLEKAKQDRDVEQGSRMDRHLENLIRLAIADGELTPYEMRSIQSAASNAGFDKPSIRKLMVNVRTQAEEQSALMQGS